MDATNAQRQRRYRARQKAHNAGDHALCDPKRPCLEAPPVAPVTAEVTAAVTPDPPIMPAEPVPTDNPLGPGGARLWRELGGESAEAGRRVLIVEACRITDRLDKLDRLLRGDAADWLEFVETRGNPERQELVINAPLAESRQQATALKQIVAELRQIGAAGEGKPAGIRPSASSLGDTAGGDRVPAGVASLAARIAAKRGNASAG